VNRGRMLLLLLAALAGWLFLFQDEDAETDLRSEAQQREPVVRTTRTTEPERGALAEPILRLKQRPAYVAGLSRPEREAPIFGVTSFKPAAQPVQVAPPVAPSAPPLPYSYIGKKSEGGVWEVYLALGEEIRVAKPNTVMDQHYRVDRIAPPTLALTYLPLNQAQNMSIGDID